MTASPTWFSGDEYGDEKAFAKDDVTDIRLKPSKTKGLEGRRRY